LNQISTSYTRQLTKRLIVSGLSLLSLFLIPESLRPDSTDSVEKAYVAMAIQGDLSGATDLFSDLSFRDDPDTDRLRKQFEERFVRHPGNQGALGQGPLLQRVASTYQDYWRLGLLGDTTVAGEMLTKRLSALPVMQDDTYPIDVNPFEALRVSLRRNGIHFLETEAPPFRDLFLWKKDSTKRYTVQLTDRKLSLTVHLMDDFLLQGWKDFASLGLVSTTGWVENDELYCLAWAYDTSSESFKVSYLKHEARHLVDLEKFPTMNSEELEYRAKLTELAFADRTLKRILSGFAAKAAENPESAHAMANWRVTRDIYFVLNELEMPEGFADWDSMGVGKVNRAARVLLRNSTELQEK
jgi:hypothetical protein